MYAYHNTYGTIAMAIENFGAWLAATRAAKDETLRSLGDKADVSDAYVKLLESGRRRPSRKVAIKIAEALGGDVDDVLQSLGFTPEKKTSSNLATGEDQPVLTYITDPLQAEAVKLFQGLPPEFQQLGITSLKGLKTAADIVREREEAQRTGKRADRDENPSQRATQQEIHGDDE